MVEAKIVQILMNGIHQLLAGKRVKPGFVWTSASAYFGDDHEILRIWIERLLDKLIGHVRSVVVAGINVVHARLDGFAQNSDGGVDIPRRSPDARASQLHGAVAHAV